MPSWKKKTESQSEPSKRPSSSRGKIQITAFSAQEMGLEQECRFKAATDAFLAEIVRQKIGRGNNHEQ